MKIAIVLSLLVTSVAFAQEQPPLPDAQAWVVVMSDQDSSAFLLNPEIITVGNQVFISGENVPYYDGDWRENNTLQLSMNYVVSIMKFTDAEIGFQKAREWAGMVNSEEIPAEDEETSSIP